MYMNSRARGSSLLTFRTVAVLTLLATYAVSAPAPTPAVAAGVGTVIISDWQFPDTLNWLQTQSAATQRFIDAMWDPLIRDDDHSHPFGDLAQTVPTLDNDLAVVHNGHLTVTIDLKPNLEWSDGQPITSADVLFGWQVYMNAATGPDCAGSCDAISSITLPDASTAIIQFNGVYGNYLQRLPPVLPQHAFTSVSQAATTLATDAGYNYENSSYVTSGPYQVSAFVANDHVTLSPNPHYTALPGPYLQTLQFIYYDNKPGLIAAAANNQTDETEDYSVADVPTLLANGANYTVELTPSFFFEHLRYNVSAVPLNDVKVRQAMNMAIDRLGLCKTASGLSAALCSQIQQEGPLSPRSAYAEPVQGLSYDPTQAKTLLGQSSYAGQTITLVTTSGNPTRQAEANAIVQDWSAIGLKATVSTVSASQLFGSWSQNGILVRGTFQVALFAEGSGQDDPDVIAYDYDSQDIPSATSFGENYGRVDDAQLDADFAAIAAAPDQIQREGIVTHAMQRIVSQAYMLTLFNMPDITTHDQALGGFLPGPGTNTWNVFEWYATSSNPTAPPQLQTPAIENIHPGWNLLDLPVNSTGIGSLGGLTSSIDQLVGAGTVEATAIYGQGRFTLYVPGYSNDQVVSMGQGIFVLAQRSGTWAPPGTALTAGQPVPLGVGWNLVATPFPLGGLPTDTIAAEVPGTQEVVTYSGGAYHVYRPGVDAPFPVPPSAGMWVLTSQSSTWTPS